MQDSNDPVTPKHLSSHSKLMNEVIGEIQIKIYWIGTAFAILLAWALYIARVVFGMELPGHDPNRPSRPIAFLIVAIGMTVLAPIWTLARVRKAAKLAREGHETIGTVVAIAPFSKAGLIPTTIAYSVDGQAYTTRKDLAKDSMLGEGMKVRVLYDPKSPQKCDVFVLPEALQPGRSE